jgi:hypothetical protein
MEAMFTIPRAHYSIYSFFKKIANSCVFKLQKTMPYAYSSNQAKEKSGALKKLHAVFSLHSYRSKLGYCFFRKR